MNQREPARRTIRTWKWLRLVVCLSVLSSLGGCSIWNETGKVFSQVKRTTHVEPHYFEYVRSDRVAQKEARLLAEQAWAASPYIADATPDFENGFVEGFADYLYRGGSGEPPVIPPRGYWNLRFLNQYGKVSVNAWYDGFRAGVADCKARGLRENWLVPTSLVAEAKPASSPPEWSDEETWDEETYRKRIEELKRNRLDPLRDPEEPPRPARGMDDLLSFGSSGAGAAASAADDSSNESEDPSSGDVGSDIAIDSDETSDSAGDTLTPEDLGLGDERGAELDLVPEDSVGTDSNEEDDRGAFDVAPVEPDGGASEGNEPDGLDDLFGEEFENSDGTDSKSDGGVDFGFDDDLQSRSQLRTRGSDGMLRYREPAKIARRDTGVRQTSGIESTPRSTASRKKNGLNRLRASKNQGSSKKASIQRAFSGSGNSRSKPASRAEQPTTRSANRVTRQQPARKQPQKNRFDGKKSIQRICSLTFPAGRLTRRL